MYSSIMIPVDLKHTDRLDKALSVAADVSKLYGSKMHVVGVTYSAPSEVARSPMAYTEKLAEFAADHSQKLGVTFLPHAEIGYDPLAGLDSLLKRAADTIGVDLIVMASHVPGFAEYFFASNAGYLASHVKISVFVVR